MHVLAPQLLSLLLRVTAPRLGADRDERGASAVEYGLLVALIAVIIIVAVTALGGKLSGVFDKTSSSLPS